MARPTGMFRLKGSQGDTTFVNSPTYGDHTRARRSPGAVNGVLKAHSKRTNTINKLCKSIKDPFDPYRENFRDGTFWSRLQSLARIQLATQKTFDWTALEDFEFFASHRLDSLMSVEITSAITAHERKTLALTVSTFRADSIKNQKATHYQQSIVALFLDKNSKPTLSSETNLFAAKSMEYQTQTAQWIISPKTTIVLVAVKCELFKDGEAIKQPNMKGMKIVLALDLRSIEKNKKWKSTENGKTFSSKNIDKLSDLVPVKKG